MRCFITFYPTKYRSPAMSLVHIQVAANLRGTCMNAVSLCRFISRPTHPREFTRGNGMEAVIDSIPIRSTRFHSKSANLEPIPLPGIANLRCHLGSILLTPFSLRLSAISVRRLQVRAPAGHTKKTAESIRFGRAKRCGSGCTVESRERIADRVPVQEPSSNAQGYNFAGTISGSGSPEATISPFSSSRSFSAVSRYSFLPARFTSSFGSLR
jgi:hypothetical protein